ncbi:DUF1624 domain-containing protein [Candidatus Peregrinibacteria bacterium]|nr:DUF1624 domain-containing protein [Candidatus Peregrinibacteria bacterium]
MHRHVEVDLGRLTAMFLMAIFHLTFDLMYFYGWQIDMEQFGWRMLQRVTVSLFLLIVGMSAVLMRQSILTRSRSDDSGIVAAGVWRKFLRRFITIGCAALLISAVTYIIDPQTFIRFGVLHCIAVSMLMLPFVLPLGLWNAVLGMAILLLPYWIGTSAPDTELLLPLGLVPAGFSTLDFVPLFPWLGVILIGGALGHALYVMEWMPKWKRVPRWLERTSVLGRYSLSFYLIHQPILLLILFLILGFPSANI